MRLHITNQVPLVDCGLILAPSDKNQLAIEYDKDVKAAAEVTKDDAAYRNPQPLRREIIDTTNFYPVQHKKGPDLLAKMFKAVGEKFDAFAKKTQPNEFKGIAEAQPIVELVRGNAPMTWSMLYEADAETIRNKATIAESAGGKDKIRRTKARKVAAKKPTLAEVFKKKEQEVILTEAAAAARGYFSLNKVDSKIIEPARLGRDDTSKSTQDLSEESMNRISWERSRSAASLQTGTSQAPSTPKYEVY